MRVGRPLVGLAGGVSFAWLLPFGLPPAWDEIACNADCYVEELVRRRATSPGLASSSSR
jgi:hypothetical protein